MSNRFFSPLEEVDPDEKSQWLEHPVTKALIATIDDLSVATKDGLVNYIKRHPGPFGAEEGTYIQAQGVALKFLDSVREHITYVRRRDGSA